MKYRKRVIRVAVVCAILISVLSVNVFGASPGSPTQTWGNFWHSQGITLQAGSSILYSWFELSMAV